MAKTNGTKAKKDVLEEVDDELELMDADDEDEAPKAKRGRKATGKTESAKPAKAESTGYGAAWLAEHVNDVLGTDLDATKIRVILRKLANDGDLDREVGTDRARYSFTGENDRTVKKVIAAIKSGAADKAKSDNLAKARAAKAEKAKSTVDEDEAPKAKRGAKKAAEPEPEAAPTKARRKRA